MAEIVGAFGCGDGLKDAGDGCPKVVLGAGGRLAQQRLELGEQLLAPPVS
jgi:hypothetical protein